MLCGAISSISLHTHPLGGEGHHGPHCNSEELQTRSLGVLSRRGAEIGWAAGREASQVQGEAGLTLKGQSPLPQTTPALPCPTGPPPLDPSSGPVLPEVVKVCPGTWWGPAEDKPRGGRCKAVEGARGHLRLNTHKTVLSKSDLACQIQGSPSISPGSLPLLLFTVGVLMASSVPCPSQP